MMIAPTLTTPPDAPLFAGLCRARRHGTVTPAQLGALLDLAEAADAVIGRLVMLELKCRTGDGRAVDVVDETIGVALDRLSQALADPMPSRNAGSFNRARGAALGALLLAGEVCRDVD